MPSKLPPNPNPVGWVHSLQAFLRGDHERRITELTDVLYNAEAFVQSVTHWDGGQDDQEEALREIRKALSDERNAE
jgi:hypothetical protein